MSLTKTIYRKGEEELDYSVQHTSIDPEYLQEGDILEFHTAEGEKISLKFVKAEGFFEMQVEVIDGERLLGAGSGKIGYYFDNLLSFRNPGDRLMHVSLDGNGARVNKKEDNTDLQELAEKVKAKIPYSLD